MTLATFGLLVAGLIVLTLGGEALVRGASALAQRVGISALVIGLTVVAFGTSAPELVVSLLATYQGNPDLAVGNIVGSNIFNVLFILGLCALLKPLVVNAQLVQRDVPIMIGASVLFWFFASDGLLVRWEAVVLFAGLITFVTYTVIQCRRETETTVKEDYRQEIKKKTGWAKLGVFGDLLFVAAGLGFLILGARWLVSAAITIAHSLGVDDVVIGLTIVAAGTSLPEVATSIIATIRGQRDIAIGNVIGSNIFNVLGILGLAGAVAPNGLPVAESMAKVDVPVAVAVAFACLPLFARKHLIERWEGGVFLFYYAAYTTYLVMLAKKYDGLPQFNQVMLTLVIPLTTLTFGILLYRTWSERRSA
jgi:cation:H+ antiporter